MEAYNPVNLARYVFYGREVDTDVISKIRYVLDRKDGCVNYHYDDNGKVKLDGWMYLCYETLMRFAENLQHIIDNKPNSNLFLLEN